MSIANFVVEKKVTVVMLTLGMILLGLISYIRLPQELFPPIVFPQVTIITEYVNAAPEEIETLITRPIEEAVGSVAGLSKIESISREGRSTIKVSFNWGQNIDFAALAVREKIDLVKEKLPKESEDPVVLKFDPLAKPILVLSVTGQQSTMQLKYLSEKIIKENIEKLDGVASASISGGLDREILVNVDQGRLQANHLSLLQLIEELEKSNISYPAGSIKKGLYEYLIRTMGEFRNLNEIEHSVAGTDVVEKMRQQDTSFLEKGESGPRETVDARRDEFRKQSLEKRLVLIKDVADVIDGTSERSSIARNNGKENILISIQKQANSNTIQVVNRIQQALKLLDEDLDSRGMECKIIYDHSIFIRQSIDDLFSDALSGGVLAFIVLLISLRAFGPAFLVTASIPITVLGTFILLSVSGITLNTMSLGGLALGVGMIVDTSIVVLENIFRRRQIGEDSYSAAVQGANEMIWPVITSNATTIAVFFPLIVFVPGITGQLFKDLSWTIIHSQIISTIIPLTLVPMVSVYLNVKSTGYKPLVWTGPLERFVNTQLSINQKIRRSGLIVLFTFLFCSTAFLIFPRLEREVLPKVDQGQFLVNLTMPLGTRLEVADRVSKKIEELILQEPAVKDVAVTLGSEKTSRAQVKIDTLRPSQGVIIVTLDEKRNKTSADIAHEFEEKIKDLHTEGGRVDFVMQENEFAFAQGGAKPILLEVKGYDFDMLKKQTEDLQTEMGKIPGIYNIQNDLGQTSPETKLIINKNRAALYGISSLDVSLIAKAALGGVVATQYREGGKEYDVRVRLSEKDRNELESLGDMLLFSKVLDALIPLKEVVQIVKSISPSEIKRINQERTVLVSADIRKGYKDKDILAQVKNTLRGMTILPEIAVSMSGKEKELKESFIKITFAFVLAVILVYMIMASQFESFLQPMIIMLTVPLAFFGIAVALLISGTSVNVISALGMIILVGTAVNNGIVLIEYINQLREQGMDVEEAAFESARTRTRPIIMSVLTSVVGLIPLAISLGEGAELRAPMAVTMIGGLLSSTLLTLIVIPCFYIFVTRLTEKLSGTPEEV